MQLEHLGSLPLGHANTTSLLWGNLKHGGLTVVSGWQQVGVGAAALLRQVNGHAEVLQPALHLRGTAAAQRGGGGGTAETWPTQFFHTTLRFNSVPSARRHGGTVVFLFGICISELSVSVSPYTSGASLANFQKKKQPWKKPWKSLQPSTLAGPPTEHNWSCFTFWHVSKDLECGNKWLFVSLWPLAESPVVH